MDITLYLGYHSISSNGQDVNHLVGSGLEGGIVVLDEDRETGGLLTTRDVLVPQQPMDIK